MKKISSTFVMHEGKGSNHDVERDGWYLDRQKGSHRQYKHADKKGVVTIASHSMSDEIAK